MALVLADRVQDTTTTTGTGTVTLSGTAPSGYQTFGTAIGDANTTYYTIAGGAEWEVGVGTYTTAGTTLSRDTVLASSAGGTTKVTFSAGTKNVFVTYPAEKSVNLDGSGVLNVPNALKFTGVPLSAASWTTNGLAVTGGTYTLTDTSTAASGTVASQVGMALPTNTFASTNASVTITDAAALYVPAINNGANTTITNKWSAWFPGALRVDAGVTLGNTGVVNIGINNTSNPINIGTGTSNQPIYIGNALTSQVQIGSSLKFFSSISKSAWGTGGGLLNTNQNIILTDTTTAASTTIATAASYAFNKTSVAATNTGVVITDLYNVYIQHPGTSTNVTATNLWSLFVQGSASIGSAISGAIVNIGGANGGSPVTNINSGGGATASTLNLGSQGVINIGVNNTSSGTYINTGTNNQLLSLGSGLQNISVNSKLSLFSASNSRSYASWGLGGVMIASSTASVTLTDTTTAASATIAAQSAYAFGPTIQAASSTGVTITDLSNLYVGNAAAGANVTATNAWAIYAAGAIKIVSGGLVVAAGGVNVTGASTFTGGTLNLNVNASTNTVNIGTGTTTGAVTIGNSANKVILGGGMVTAAVRVVTAAGAITVTANDYAIVVNKTVGAATTVNLFASPATGTTIIIKDGKGDAGTNAITVTPAAGTIDGSATYVIGNKYGSITLVYNSTEWNVI